MDEGSDVRDHLNIFNKLITQLGSVGVKVDNEDKALLLLTSLPQSYKKLGDNSNSWEGDFEDEGGYCNYLG